MRRREFIAGLGRAAVAVPNRKHGVSPAANFDCIAHRARRWTRARESARTVFKPSPTRLSSSLSVVKIIPMIAAILMLWASNATAQERLAVGPCVADLRKLCPGIPPGNSNLRACMREHIRDVSSPCLLTLAKFAEVRGSLKECSAHLHQQCASVERTRFEDCPRSAVASLSDTCKDALARAVRRTRARAVRRTRSSARGLHTPAQQ